MIDRDCENCVHHTNDGCSSWDCEFEAKDLISRADAIDAVRYLIYDRQVKGAKPFKWWFIKQRLNAIPSADAVHGEWIWRTDIPIGDGRTSAGYICSHCGKDYWHGNKLKFCPNCGAKMKGGDEE